MGGGAREGVSQVGERSMANHLICRVSAADEFLNDR